MTRNRLHRQRNGWSVTLCVVAAGCCVLAAGVAPAQQRSASEPRAGRPRDGKPGRGKGVFVKITNQVTRIDPRAFESIRGVDDVAGVQVTVSWAQLEPRPGEFNWSPVEEVLARYAAIDKQVAFMVATVGGKMSTDSQLRKGRGRADPDLELDNDCTPAWFFKLPDAKRVGDIETSKGKLPPYPLYWDPVYQRRLELFIAEFARRFDGDPRIEFIRMGGWQTGTNEPSFYGGASNYMKEQLEREGETIAGQRRPRLSADSRYADAVRDLVDIWAKYFRKTRLAATIHVSKRGGSFEEAMNEHCARKGILLLNTGLNESDLSKARSAFRDYADRTKTKVGWGGITHIGRHSSEAEKSRFVAGVQGEAFRQGVGSDSDKRYSPASRASYFVVGLEMLEHREALHWAAQNVVD